MRERGGGRDRERGTRAHTYTLIHNSNLFQIHKIIIQIVTSFFFFQYGSSDWSKFAPRTNACWLHYIVNKMAIKSRVKYVTRENINTALNPFVNKFLDYNSAKEIFLEFFSQPSPLSYKSKR